MIHLKSYLRLGIWLLLCCSLLIILALLLGQAKQGTTTITFARKSGDDELWRLYLAEAAHHLTVRHPIQKRFEGVPALSPDERYAAWASPLVGLASVVNLHTGRTFNSGYGSLNVWSPDGQWLVSPISNSIRLIHPDTMQSSEIVLSFDYPAQARSFTWDSSGQWLIVSVEFATRVLPTQDLVLINLNNRQVRRLTDTDRVEHNPVWSMDRSVIYFLSYEGSDYRLEKIDPDGRNRQTLRMSETWLDELHISPDGQTLAYTDDRHSVLWNPVTDDEWRLGQRAAEQQWLDSDRLVFVAIGSGDLYLAELAKQRVTRITRMQAETVLVK